METSTVENRLQTLEAQVRELLRLVKAPTSAKQRVRDWRQSLGMFDGHPFMKQIDEAGHQIRQQYRETDNEHS